MSTKKKNRASRRYTENAFCENCRPGLMGYAEWKSTNAVDDEWIRITGGECGECELVMSVGDPYYFFTQSSNDPSTGYKGSAQLWVADRKAEAAAEAAAVEADQLTIEDAITEAEAEADTNDQEQTMASIIDETPETPATERPRNSWSRLIQLAERASTSTASTAELRHLNQLDYLTEIIEQAERMRAIEVDKAREVGASWAQIGAELGVSKQAASQRYGKKP